MERILPQTNSYLIGHDEAEDLFLQAWKNGNLHNSWLISGPEGIGKATFAYKAARFLLSADEQQKEMYHSLNVSENEPAYRLIANRSHPNLKILERDFTENDKKKIIKAIKEGEAMDEEALSSLKKSAVIKVDEIRTVNEFLSKKAFDGNWRIVVIDSVDDLNTASANALLKILEEPPAKSLIFLISHNPHRLLPTIRSRCTKLNLQPLNETQTALLLRRYCPDLNESEVLGITKLCGGSIGCALRYADNGALTFYKKLEKLFYAGKNFDLPVALSLCDEAAKNEDVWDFLKELIGQFISVHVLNGEKVKELSEVNDRISMIFRDTLSLNMDKKQALLLIITEIGKAMQ